MIDAADLIVAPGFFDPHTHYDAQICWDPLVTCSSWHGVTSVIMGNCGVGIAPCRPQTREIATWDLVNVEGIPFEVLSKGTTWDWQSFPEYMDAAEKRGSGLNLGFLAPLTPFRHYVMGEESMERAARPAEIAQIKAMIKEAVAAGAVGFSHTRLRQHIGYQGRPLACRHANLEELKSYANALRELGKGTIEISLSQEIDTLSKEEAELLDVLLTESGRPVTWLSLVPLHGRVESCLETLDQIEPLIARGGIPQVTAHTSRLQLNLRNPFLMASLNSWKSLFNQPPEEQKKIYADPGFRNAFREEMRRPQIFTSDWNRVDVDTAGNPALKRLEGKTIVEIGRERGRDPLDTFIDIALEDDLATWFSVSMMDESLLAPLLNDRRTLIGLADGGAHVDLLCDAGYYHLSARNLVARQAGAEPGRRGAPDHVGARRPVWLSAKRAAGRGTARRHHDLRLQHYRLDRTREVARRSARRRPPPGHPGAGRGVHGRQRRGAVRARQAHRRDARTGAAAVSAAAHEVSLPEAGI